MDVSKARFEIATNLFFSAPDCLKQSFYKGPIVMSNHPNKVTNYYLILAVAALFNNDLPFIAFDAAMCAYLIR